MVAPVSTTTRGSGSLKGAELHALLDAVADVNTPLLSVCASAWESPGRLPADAAFDAGATLAALLQDGLLPAPAQRLVAIYMLFDVISSSRDASGGGAAASVEARLIASPLGVVLFDLSDRADTRASEQLFMGHLLAPAARAAGAAALPAPGQVAESSASSLFSSLEAALRAGAPLPKQNVSALRRAWNERHPEGDRKKGLEAVSAVVRDPDLFPPAAEGGGKGVLRTAVGAEVGLVDFVPPFARPPPPVMAVGADCSELRWIDPEPMHEVVWDVQMCADTRGGDLRDLMATALRSPLKEEQQQLVKTRLESSPRLVFQCGLTPQNLPDLVQNNSVIATEVLLRLLMSNQKEDYFASLVSMDMNANSMAVVGRLTNAIPLPSEFLHTYVSNCIRSCSTIPDRYGQVRMVRFVCVFLQALIRNNHIDVQDLFVEVQAFCIEHSRIREATGLFRLLTAQGNGIPSAT